MEIKNPEWLEMVADGKTFYGLDQLWYRSRFQRLAGCGPTTASTLLFYMNKRENGPLRYGYGSREEAVLMMEDVWHFVTPGFKGLHRIDKFVRGLEKFFRKHDLPWKCKELPVRAGKSVAEAADFVEEGIASDCPVAFLNLHVGEATDIQGWHWIPLTGIRRESGKVIASGLDEGREIEFDLSRWVETTKSGGGFVYIAKR